MLCLALALALAGLTTIPAGCKEEDEPFGCTLELNYSLLLSIVDAETGEPILDATVTFLIDGDGPHDAVRDEPGTVRLGEEQDGTFEVTVSADGYETVMREYEVTSDECHVMTMSATVELTPSP